MVRDDAWFERFYESHQSAVSAYCLRRVGAADAADATAQVFAVAWRRSNDIPEGERAVRWMYGVARRVVSHQWRGAGRDDQTTRWLPFQGADTGPANRANADYLRAIRPVEYEAVCNPAAYEPGTINADGGLALTAACAELWAPLGDDVARFIREGTVPLAEWATRFDQQCVDTTAALSEPGLTAADYEAVNNAALSEMRAIPQPDQMAHTAAGLIDAIEASTDSTERTQAEIDALDQQVLDAMTSLGVSDSCIGNPGG